VVLVLVLGVCDRWWWGVSGGDDGGGGDGGRAREYVSVQVCEETVLRARNERAKVS
jgi:hypothetical protein